MRRRLFTALALAAAFAVPAQPARAESTTYDTPGPTLVRVSILQGDVTVRTWDRAQVQIDADPGVDTERRSVDFPPDRNIPILQASIASKDGPVVLPAETFVVSSVANDLHEAIALTGRGNVVMSIPADTPLLIVQVGRGRVTISDMRQGTFIVRVRNGTAVLQHVGRDGFVQVMQGAVAASDSAFTRLRVRTALAGIWFENCRASQIEVTSVSGSVVFDNGSFEPGLARFEAANAPVALGINGPATVNAHATDGQVYTLLDRRSTSDVRGGDGAVTLAGGGPLVTASSGASDIYVYNGTLKDRRDIPAAWLPFVARLKRTVPRPPPDQRSSE